MAPVANQFVTTTRVVGAMVEMPSEALVQCSPETIFDLIVDFRGQDRWLTKSSAFHGTSDVSSNPVTLGTTYREPGPFGVRNGTVDVTVRYTLTPAAGSTHDKRVVTLGIPWSLRLFQPLVAREFRIEADARCSRSRLMRTSSPGRQPDRRRQQGQAR